MRLATPFTERYYLAYKSFIPFVSLNAKVKFSGKFPNFKLDATASAGFSFSYIIRDVKQHIFAKTNSQCCLTD